METEDDSGIPGTFTLLAVAASILLCWIFYRVRMRQCEAVLLEVSRTLQEVRATAEALQTRGRVIKAATETAEKALLEYNVFLNMLHQMQEGDYHRPDLPILRHQLEVETMRAQVSMVQGCLLAVSQEVLNLGALPPDTDENKQQGDKLTTLHLRRESFMNMSEELITLLNKHSSEHMKLSLVEDKEPYNQDQNSEVFGLESAISRY